MCVVVVGIKVCGTHPAAEEQPIKVAVLDHVLQFVLDMPSQRSNPSMRHVELKRFRHKPLKSRPQGGDAAGRFCIRGAQG